MWVGISWKVSGLGASEWTKVRGNYICCLVVVVIFVGGRGGGFKVITRREGEKATKKRNFYGEP